METTASLVNNQIMNFLLLSVPTRSFYFFLELGSGGKVFAWPTYNDRVYKPGKGLHK